MVTAVTAAAITNIVLGLRISFPPWRKNPTVKKAIYERTWFMWTVRHRKQFIWFPYYRNMENELNKLQRSNMHSDYIRYDFTYILLSFGYYCVIRYLKLRKQICAFFVHAYHWLNFISPRRRAHAGQNVSLY